MINFTIRHALTAPVRTDTDVHSSDLFLVSMTDRVLFSASGMLIIVEFNTKWIRASIPAARTNLTRPELSGWSSPNVRDTATLETKIDMLIDAALNSAIRRLSLN